jgi:hypothetical protein
MSERPRWVVALVVAVLIGALIAVARGRDHHRGDEVGARGAETAQVAPEA